MAHKISFWWELLPVVDRTISRKFFNPCPKQWEGGTDIIRHRAGAHPNLNPLPCGQSWETSPGQISYWVFVYKYK